MHVTNKVPSAAKNPQSEANAIRIKVNGNLVDEMTESLRNEVSSCLVKECSTVYIDLKKVGEIERGNTSSDLKVRVTNLRIHFFAFFLPADDTFKKKNQKQNMRRQISNLMAIIVWPSQKIPSVCAWIREIHRSLVAKFEMSRADAFYSAIFCLAYCLNAVVLAEASDVIIRGNYPLNPHHHATERKSELVANYDWVGFLDDLFNPVGLPALFAVAATLTLFRTTAYIVAGPFRNDNTTLLCPCKNLNWFQEACTPSSSMSLMQTPRRSCKPSTTSSTSTPSWPRPAGPFTTSSWSSSAGSSSTSSSTGPRSPSSPRPRCPSTRSSRSRSDPT